MSLSQEDYDFISGGAGGPITAAAVARLYRSNGTSWDYSQQWGAVALVADKGTHFLRLISMTNGQSLFEEELYDNFDYLSAKPFFHTFEGRDAVYGLSFADESDAETLLSSISAVAANPATHSESGTSYDERSYAPTPSALPSMPSKPAPPIPGYSSSPSLPSPSNSYAGPTPSVTMTPSPTDIGSTPTPTPSYAQSVPPMSRAQSAGNLPVNTKKSEPKKSGNKFGGFFKKFMTTTESSPSDDVVLSGPVKYIFIFYFILLNFFNLINSFFFLFQLKKDWIQTRKSYWMGSK